MRLVFGIARPSVGDFQYVRTREVERRYPGVPRAGEHVDIDDSGEHALSVESVSWEADGTVFLEFGEADHLSDAELDDIGFTAIPSDEVTTLLEPGNGGFQPANPGTVELAEHIDTDFTATPPRELENLQSVLDYLAPPTVGEVLTQLECYPLALPVEITSDDEDWDHDTIFSRYPSGSDGEGTEFVDLQAVALRASMSRPADPPTSNCILCGATITAGPEDALGYWRWVHRGTGLRRCQTDPSSEDGDQHPG